MSEPDRQSSPLSTSASHSDISNQPGATPISRTTLRRPPTSVVVLQAIALRKKREASVSTNNIASDIAASGVWDVPSNMSLPMSPVVSRSRARSPTASRTMSGLSYDGGSIRPQSHAVGPTSADATADIGATPRTAGEPPILREDAAGHLSLHLQSFALLLLQHLGPLGIQYLEESVRGYRYRGGHHKPPVAVKDSSMILSSGPSGAGRAVTAARNLMTEKAISKQQRSEFSKQRRRLQIIKECREALNGGSASSGAFSEVVSQLSAISSSSATLANSGPKPAGRGRKPLEDGIDMRGFVLATLKCLAHANRLYGSCSYPWERKCLRTATGQRIFSDFDTVGRRPKGKGSGLIGAFGMDTTGSQHEEADHGDDAVVLTAVGESSSKGGGEERLDFLPDSVRRHGGAYFGTTDTFPFYLKSSTSSTRKQLPLLASGDATNVLESSASATSPRMGVPDVQQVMDAFLLAASKVFVPAELPPSLVALIATATRDARSHPTPSTTRIQRLLDDSSASLAYTGSELVVHAADTSAAASLIPAYVAHAIWFTNGPTHWEFPSICPTYSLPPNPLLDGQLLPYALMRLFRVMDRSNADQLEWESIAAFFSEVADRQNSNSVKTKQVMRQRALLSLNCGGRSLGSTGSGSMAQIHAVPTSMRILTALLDSLSSGSSAAPAQQKLTTVKRNILFPGEPDGDAVEASRLRLVHAISEAGGISLPPGIPASISSNLPAEEEAALAMEAVTNAFGAVNGADAPRFERSTSMQVPTWGPNSQGGGAEPSTRYSPFMVHCMCSPNTSRFIVSTSDNDVIFLDCSSLGVRGELPRMVPYGPLYSASPAAVAGGSVGGASSLPAVGNGVLLNPADVTPQTREVMHSFSMDTTRGAVGGTTQHINRSKDEGLSTTPSLLLSDRTSFVTSMHHFILPASLQLKGSVRTNTKGRRGAQASQQSKHHAVDIDDFVRERADEADRRYNDRLSAVGGGGKRLLFDDRTDGILAFGCADSHLRLYYYGGNTLESVVLAHVEPFGSPPTCTHYVPELKQLYVGTIDGSIHRLTSRVTNSSSLSSKESAGGDSTSTADVDFDAYQRSRFAKELHPYWFPPDSSIPKDVLLWKREALSYSLHSPITAMCYVTTDSCIAIATASGVVAFFDADTFAPHHMRRTIALGSNDCLVGSDVGAADGSGFDGMPSSVYALAYSEDFDILAVGSTMSTPLLVTREGSPLALYGGSVTHEGTVCSVEFIRGTSLFLSGDASGLVRVWDIRKLQCIDTLRPCPDEAAVYQRTVGELNVLRAKRTREERHATLRQLASGYVASKKGGRSAKSNKSPRRNSTLIKEDEADERAKEHYNTMCDSTVLRWLQRMKTDEGARLARSQRRLKAQAMFGTDDHPVEPTNSTPNKSDMSAMDPATSLRPTTTVQLRRPLRNLVSLNINFVEGTLDVVGARGVERYTHRWIPAAIPKDTSSSSPVATAVPATDVATSSMVQHTIPTTQTSFASKEAPVGGTGIAASVGPVVCIKQVQVQGSLVAASMVRTEAKRAKAVLEAFLEGQQVKPEMATLRSIPTTTTTVPSNQCQPAPPPPPAPPLPPLGSPFATEPSFYAFETRSKASSTPYTISGHSFILGITSGSMLVWDTTTGLMCLEGGPLPVSSLHKAHLQEVHDAFEVAASNRMEKLGRLRHSINGIVEGLSGIQEQSVRKAGQSFSFSREAGPLSVESVALSISPPVMAQTRPGVVDSDSHSGSVRATLSHTSQRPRSSQRHSRRLCFLNASPTSRLA